jgi:hypothetical protein
MFARTFTVNGDGERPSAFVALERDHPDDYSFKEGEYRWVQPAMPVGLDDVIDVVQLIRKHIVEVS